jgi:hypothetical protein
MKSLEGKQILIIISAYPTVALLVATEGEK